MKGASETARLDGYAPPGRRCCLLCLSRAGGAGGRAAQGVDVVRDLHRPVRTPSGGCTSRVERTSASRARRSRRRSYGACAARAWTVIRRRGDGRGSDRSGVRAAAGREGLFAEEEGEGQGQAQEEAEVEEKAPSP